MPLLTSLSNTATSGSAGGGSSQVFQLSASSNTVSEGTSVLIILADTNHVIGEEYAYTGDQIQYTITGISQADLSFGSLTGSFTLDSSGSSQLEFIIFEDSLTEGTETLTMTLNSYSEVSVNVVISDTSTSPDIVGEVEFIIPGTYTWTAPAGVTSVSAVAVGGGGGAPVWYGASQGGTGGGGGGLGYRNNISVTPGSNYTVVVGAGGETGYAGNGGTGGTSYFFNTTTCRGSGGVGGNAQYGTSDVSGGTGGAYAGDGGGAGGTGIIMDVTYKTGQAGGGSGAGGYGYSGGYGGGSTTIVSNFSFRPGGNGTYSGAGGGIFMGSSSTIGRAGAGGGTGLYGRSGTISTTTQGGSYNVGQNGGNGGMYNTVAWPTLYDGAGQPIPATTMRYGGGAGARNDNAAARGSSGAVRIMWGGARTFPSNAAYMAQPSPSTTVTLTQTLNNPNAYDTSQGDYFGYSVSIDGNYAIVGAVNEDDAGGTNSGKAYIFNVTTGTLVHTLDNPNAYDTSADDRFGLSVAISGDYCIVGAYAEDEAGGNSGSGKAYIYNVATGELLHTLDNPNAYSTSANDLFGYTVAISGNYAIVGAVGEDDAGGTSSGKAYIFNVTTGELVHTLNNPNAYGTSVSDQFGLSVAISGNYCIVGAGYEDEAGGTNSGKAYIYNVATGALLHTLNNPNAYSTSDGDVFGLSVAISGNYAIVGAYLEDDAGSNSGKAYIFNVVTGALVHTLNNPNAYSTSDGDVFGFSVAISGNYAIVSAYLEDDSSATESGKAYIFNVTTGALVATLDNPNAYGTSASDQFGYSVEISGNYAIVSTYQEDDAGGDQSGKAYIFRISQD